MRKKEVKIIERYNSEIHYGLNDEQVGKRKDQNLVNNTKQKTSKSYLRIFTDNLFTYFNFLWLIIFIALLAVESYSNLLFIIVIVFNTGIAIFQEIRSKKTVAKLSLVTVPKVNVVRNGEEIEITPSQLVLDDIIVLSLGNQIPADSTLVEGLVEVNESLLTGESRPVKKENGSSLLAGSFLTSGKCYARVDKVGNESYVQKLAKEAKKFKQPTSNLFRDLNKIIKWIGIFIIPIGILTFCNIYFFAGTGNLSTSVEKTCGSLVGMIPAGMFLLVSVALTVGVIKLAERKTLVQNLYSIEMLARSNILCLDKTGTITDGTMTVKNVIPYNNASDEEIKSSISSILFNQSIHNHTSIALTKYFGSEEKFKLTKNVSFSSDRKYTATSFEGDGTYVIGASEYIKAEMTEEITDKIKEMASEGFRVLLLAHSNKQIGEKDNLPENLKVKALIMIEDTIRKDAIKTIKWFKENNVQIKIISGDDPQTVSYIAERVGVENAKDYINLEGMSLDDVRKIAEKYTVFGRVSPEQKHIIIKSLKENNVVAMTGDGVNDTLALKEADCSIAMADGSEVARNISHLVLLNSNFSSLPSVVEEGRRVINNVQSSSTLFLMKTILTILLTLFVLAVRLEYPFEPTQLFLLEFFVIGVPSFFLALLPNKELIRGHFITYVLKKGLPYGVILFLNVAFVLLLGKFNVLTLTETNTLATLILTIIGFLNLVSLCIPYTKLKSSIVLLSLTGLVLCSVFLTNFFGLVDLTLTVYKLSLLLTLLTSVCLLIMKNIQIVKKLKRKGENV